MVSCGKIENRNYCHFDMWTVPEISMSEDWRRLENKAWMNWIIRKCSESAGLGRCRIYYEIIVIFFDLHPNTVLPSSEWRKSYRTGAELSVEYSHSQDQTDEKYAFFASWESVTKLKIVCTRFDFNHIYVKHKIISRLPFREWSKQCYARLWFYLVILLHGVL